MPVDPFTSNVLVTDWAIPNGVMALPEHALIVYGSGRRRRTPLGRLAEPRRSLGGPSRSQPCARLMGLRGGPFRGSEHAYRSIPEPRPHGCVSFWDDQAPRGHCQTKF